MKVFIENPTPGGARFTSARRAAEFVRQGCAKLSACGTKLFFVESHHAKRSAELTAQETSDQAWRLSQRYYDKMDRTLTLRECRHIPIVCVSKIR